MSNDQTPSPAQVLDVIKDLADDKILIWLDSDGRVSMRRPAETEAPTESMKRAWEIEPTIATYLDLLRFRAGLEPLTLAAGKLAEFSEDLDDDGEAVLEALGSVEWAGSGTVGKAS
jgi:hypothetical protein